MVTRLLSCALLAGLLALPLAGAACFSELTVDRCGGFEESSAACDGCLDGACCAEAEACRQSPDCAALFDCLADCGDTPDCRQTCALAHPADAAAATLARCRAELCPRECFSCGGYYQLESTACDDCMRSQCCTSLALCFNDPACWDRAICENDCSIPGCSESCANDFPVGDSLTPLIECIQRECYQACDLGHHLSCVGNFQWPKADGDLIRISGTYFDAYTGQQEPVAGLTVQACRDYECTDVLGEGVTDEGGYVSFEIPVGLDGFDGSLRVFGRDDYWPLVRWRSTPILTDFEQGYDMFSKEEIAAGAGILQLPEDGLETTSLVLTFPADCNDTFAAGVELRMDPEPPGVVQFYFNAAGIPVPSATETFDVGLGSPEGGGWALVPPGTFQTIEAWYEGEKFATTPIYVEQGWISTMTLSPTP
jgi:hypothetical protein